MLTKYPIFSIFNIVKGDDKEPLKLKEKTIKINDFRSYKDGLKTDTLAKKIKKKRGISMFVNDKKSEDMAF